MSNVREQPIGARGAGRGPSRRPGRRAPPHPVGRRRVLIVVTEDWYFWSHRLNLARAIRDAGYEVGVATPPGDLRPRIEREGFRFFPLRLRRRGRGPLGELRAICGLWLLFRRFRPDLVHLVAMKPILYGGLAARLARVPVAVCAVAGLGYAFLPGGRRRTWLRRAVEIAYRWLLRGRRFRFVLQNADDLALFEERRLAPPERLCLIRGAGVDLRRFAPCEEPPGEPVVVTHCRMLWDKGIAELVEAARLLRERNVRARFLLVGDPDPANPASIPESTLRGWERHGWIEWAGRRDDIPQLLARAHVACLPSYREGTPLSLVEAAAAGRPIVAADVPGCRGIVLDGENGLLVPPRSPHRLAAALETLLVDPGLRRRMGARSREIAEAAYAGEIVARETLELYRVALERP